MGAGVLIYQARTVRRMAAALDRLLQSAQSEKSNGSVKFGSDSGSELGCDGKDGVRPTEPQVSPVAC